MSDAADKLAQTRLAIIAHIQRREQRSGRKTAPLQREPAASDADQAADWEQDVNDDQPRGRVRGWYQRARRMGSTWWRHHPAHAGLELAKPVLSSFAARRPLAYLGISALAGAALFLARPWRLISATGLLVALLKSSQLSSMVLSALSGAGYGTDDRPPS